MLKNFFGGGGDATSSQQQQQSNGETPFVLLVVQADAYDWENIMKTANLNMKVRSSSRPLQVIQTSWDDLFVGPCDNYSRDQRHRTMIQVRKQWKNGEPVSSSSSNAFATKRSIFPDFVLIRNEFCVPGKDFKSKLLGLMYSNVPSINSLRSIYLTNDRPVMMSALNRIADPKNRKDPNLRKYPMPLMNQQFFPSYEGMMYSQAFPAVIKFGSADAGFGKMKVIDHHQMEDVHSVLPMIREGYAFGEPFLTGSHDLRLQRLGKGNYRAFKRVSVCGNWKTQTGSAMIENIEVEEKYREWLEAASTMFGDDHESGELDILTLDVLVEEKTNKEYVMELNGTSSGLGEEKEANEDNLILAKLILDRIEKL